MPDGGPALDYLPSGSKGFRTSATCKVAPRGAEGARGLCSAGGSQPAPASPGPAARTVASRSPRRADPQRHSERSRDPVALSIPINNS